MQHFAAIFALRPAGRECPFFSPRWPTTVGCRGLGGGGDAWSLTPRCSATLVSCMRWLSWINMVVMLQVRTTTSSHPRGLYFSAVRAFVGPILK